MKRFILISVLLLNADLLLFAQTADNKWNLGFSAGTTQYSGDIANGLLDFNTVTLQNNSVGSIHLTRYLTKNFDIAFMGSLGATGYYKGNQTFKQEIINFSGAFKYKVANQKLVEEKSIIRPYILAGLGMDRYKSKSGTPGGTPIDGFVLIGGGMNFMVSDKVAIFYQASYSYLFSDNRDNLVKGSLNDGYLIHSLGFNVNLGSAKDSDGDGVADKLDECAATPSKVKVNEKGCPLDGDGDGVADYQDKCPNTPGLAALAGCPDRDKDGVTDADDQCPDEAGLSALNGCPDTDSDGIIDSKDKCPNVKGILAFEGCPDTDNDGIQDSEDLCPTVAGIKLFKGCPDTDNDGIQDSEDLCPNMRGPVTTKGCPDTDLDGVHDGIDRCPTIAGVAENQGCPAIKPDVTQLFKKALQGIQFEPGKAIIKKSSNVILNAVVKVLDENPTYNLSIAGHTDDVGDDEKNMTLSKDRADAVAKYMIIKGISPERLTTFGYGETRPVDSNKTAAGRTRNRRVELNVEFKK